MSATASGIPASHSIAAAGPLKSNIRDLPVLPRVIVSSLSNPDLINDESVYS